MPDSPAALLELRKISKTFPGVKALQDVRLSARAGHVHALMGENGAGKSTLMKVLSGAYMPDPGAEILIDGQPVHIDGPLAAKNLGVVGDLPGTEPRAQPDRGREHLHGPAACAAAAWSTAPAWPAPARRRCSASAPISSRRRASATLSIAQRQLVEIARAVHFDCRILVMDEPTTPLSTHETDRLFALIRRLRDEGLAILYISHRMDEIDELADDVTVLRDGTYVGTLTRAELSRDKLVKMMVGRDLSGFYRKEHHGQHTGDEALTVRGLGDGRRVHDCSFELHAGEVLGPGRPGGRRPHRAGAADLRRRSAHRRRRLAERQPARCSKSPSRSTRSAPASSISPRTARARACSSTCRCATTST